MGLKKLLKLNEKLGYSDRGLLMIIVDQYLPNDKLELIIKDYEKQIKLREKLI